MTELLKLPLISFIVTSFNYENYVIKALDSIKNQTYENIEIIVVDDNSDDNSIKRIKDFIKKNKKFPVRLIEHLENKGQFASMQTGLESSSGQFICFINADDILIKDYAKTLIRVHLCSYVSFVSGQLIEIGENDEIQTTYSIASFQKEKCFELKSVQDLLRIDVDNVDFKVLTLKEAPFGGWYWSSMSANMFRRSVLDLILRYNSPEHWKICPDKFLLNFAHLIGESAIVYAPLVGYRRFSNNVGCSKQICGCKLHSFDGETLTNIHNNKKIRQDILDYILRYKEFFNLKLSKRGVNKLICQIHLSPFKLIFKKVFANVFKT